MPKVKDRLDQLAKDDYEASRKIVSGRPKWEDLRSNDLYDSGMIALAYERARKKLAEERSEADRDHDEDLMPGGFN